MLRTLTVALLMLAAGLAGCDTVEVVGDEGNAQTLCLADYAQCIDPILHAPMLGSLGPVTCSASGCHDVAAGSGGSFKIFASPDPASPDYDQQILANFIAAKAFANLDSPADSKLLLEPLVGVSTISGVHTGGDIFPNTADACYVAMRDWITTRVSRREDPACGVCTVPALATCGF